MGKKSKENDAQIVAIEAEAEAEAEDVRKVPVERKSLDDFDIALNDSSEGGLVGVASEVKLISVNDVEETFKIALIIHVHFRDSENFPKNDKADDEFYRISYDHYEPKLVLVNLVEGGEFDTVVRGNKKTGDIWIAYQTVASINESLELELFPFDRQLFRISFKAPDAQFYPWQLSSEILDYPSNELEESIYLVRCELNTWKVHSLQVGIHTDDPDPVSLAAAEFEISIMAERDPRFHWTNFVIIIYLIVILNCANCSIVVSESADRLAYSSALLLTLTSFKIVLSDALPRVGYLTIMDYYILISFIFLGIGTIFNVAGSPFSQCLGHLFVVDDPASGFAAFESCQETFLPRAVRQDATFQLVYFLVWTVFNIVVTVLAFNPRIMQTTWEEVMDNQIGETDDTIKRTKTVHDFDNDQDGATFQ